MQTVANNVLKAFKAAEVGYVSTPSELARKGLGTRAAVDQALSRLVRSGELRRVGRGLYCRPNRHPLVGEVPPKPEAIAAALARGTGEKAQISEGQAANLLGMSPQVPGRLVYWTNGTPRVRRVGNTVIEFKRGAPKRLVGAGSAAGAAVQAVRYLGAERAHEAVETLRSRLSAEERRELRKLAPNTPAWVGEVVKEITAEEPHG